VTAVDQSGYIQLFFATTEWATADDGQRCMHLHCIGWKIKLICGESRGRGKAIPKSTNSREQRLFFEATSPLIARLGPL